MIARLLSGLALVALGFLLVPTLERAGTGLGNLGILFAAIAIPVGLFLALAAFFELARPHEPTYREA